MKKGSFLKNYGFLICMLIGIVAGCIVGAKVPVVLTSRGASAQEKLNSLVVAALAR